MAYKLCENFVRIVQGTLHGIYILKFLKIYSPGAYIPTSALIG